MSENFIFLSMSRSMYYTISKRKKGRTVITKNFMENDYETTSYRISFEKFVKDLKGWK